MQETSNFDQKVSARTILELLGTSHELRIDITRMAALLAAFETARYYTDNMNRVKNFASDLALLEYAFSLCEFEGLNLEFGVGSGRTMNKLASLTSQPFYGFDAFSGLPETWRTEYPAGTFRQDKLPETPANVALVRGLFEVTLSNFIAEHREPASFIHIDCDLYKSTQTVFDALGSRIMRGTVIVFDEYFNYPGWQHHEFRAFQEFINKSGRTYDYVGFVSSHQQVAVRITS